MTFDLINETHRALLTKSKSTFTKSFRSNFEFVKCYHGTRLDDDEIDCVKRDGLLCPTKELLIAKAKKRFQNNHTVSFNETIEYLLDKQSLSKGVYVNLGTRDFFTLSPQYLQYGPEILVPVADALAIDHSGNFREKLIQFGRPCLVEIEFPAVNVPNHELLRIYEHVFNNWPECSLFFNHSILPTFIKQIIIVNKSAGFRF